MLNKPSSAWIQIVLVVWLVLCGSVILVGNLSASDHGMTRTIVGDEGYSRTHDAWRWPYFDGADPVH